MTVQPSNGCAVKPVINRKPSVVSVNDAVIPRAAIAQETQNHPASKPIDAWMAAARALVVRELLLQEARRIGIVAVPLGDGEGRRETDEEAQIRMLIEQEVTTPSADEEACRRYYEANRQRFRSADLYEVRHILIAADPRDRAARDAAREMAELLVRDVQLRPAGFATLAEAHSACPSGKVGGNLGQIGPGQTVSEFEGALKLMSDGDVAAVETRYGFHVVIMDRRMDGRELPFELVGERISGWMEERVRRTAIRQYIAILAGRSTISGIDLASSETPLLQ